MAHLAEPMTLRIRLLGRPGIERPNGETYRLRSRKSWALLAYLLLSETAPTRSQLAGLLFSEADDPLRALRWSLAEIRRSLGAGASIDGDPVVLRLPESTVVDVVQLMHAAWIDAVEVVGLDCELLDGVAIRTAPAFESWLLSERRRVAAAAEGILHEAAVGLLARGALDRARGFAVRAAAMSPLDENHQALLIRLYRLAGEDAAAEAQYAAWTELLETELAYPRVGSLRLRCGSDRATASGCRRRPRSRPSSRRVRRRSQPGSSNRASPTCAARCGSPTPVAAPGCACARARCSPRR